MIKHLPLVLLLTIIATAISFELLLSGMIVFTIIGIFATCLCVAFWLIIIDRIFS